ncbi:hypothetical protein Angca_006884, partial [Angiostrongylus cantonensis]
LEKWMLHELIGNKRNHHFEASSALLLRNQSDMFLDHTVTHDEKWFLQSSRRRS